LVVEDGGYHPVDSSELAFRTATQYAIRAIMEKEGNAGILEPWMNLEVTTPVEYQSQVVGLVSRRKGIVNNTDIDGDFVIVSADVGMNNMFGFSTELRSATQGKAEFSMEYNKHNVATRDVTEEVIKRYKGGKRD
jgi:elongation factor G